jgi:hypothetical protein
MWKMEILTTILPRTKITTIFRAGSSQNFTVFISLLAPFSFTFGALFAVAAPSAPVFLEHVEPASSRAWLFYLVFHQMENLTQTWSDPETSNLQSTIRRNPQPTLKTENSHLYMKPFNRHLNLLDLWPNYSFIAH